MTLKIISSEKVEFSGEVDLVNLPGELGAFTVLKNHAAIISSLTAGVIEYDVQGERTSLEVKVGIVDVDNNVVSVCIY